MGVIIAILEPPGKSDRKGLVLSLLPQDWAPPLSVRARVAPKLTASTQQGALRLSLTLAYRFSMGRARHAFRSAPVPALVRS